MTRAPYRGFRFPKPIIQHAVWLYARFTLSLRDVEELLAERGIEVSYETIRCGWRGSAHSSRAACGGSVVGRVIGGTWTRVRHEGAKEEPWVRHFPSSHAAQEMRVRPLEVGLQEQASNHPKLLS